MNPRVLRVTTKSPQFRQLETAVKPSYERYSNDDSLVRLERIAEGYPDVNGVCSNYVYSQLPSFTSLKEGEELIRIYQQEIDNIEDQINRFTKNKRESDPAPRRFMERMNPDSEFYDSELASNNKDPEEAYLNWLERSLSAISLKRQIIFLIKERLQRHFYPSLEDRIKKLEHQMQLVLVEE